jgi:hypothetical protein
MPAAAAVAAPAEATVAADVCMVDSLTGEGPAAKASAAKPHSGLCNPFPGVPAGCAVKWSTFASTINDRLLPGEGSAVLIATRLGNNPVLLLLGAAAAAAAGAPLDRAAAAAMLEPFPAAAAAAAAGGGVLGPLGAAGKSAAMTRPHAP